MGAPEVLLVKRSDNGAWTPVTGICDPGEDPDVTAVREVKEETGLDVAPEALLGVGAIPPIVHANGDRAVYLTVGIRLGIVGGNDVPIVGDEESTDVGWFSVTDLPVREGYLRMIVADAVAQRRYPERFTPRLGFHKRRNR